MIGPVDHAAQHLVEHGDADVGEDRFHFPDKDNEGGPPALFVEP
jgi:hypothetical protein